MIDCSACNAAYPEDHDRCPRCGHHPGQPLNPRNTRTLVDPPRSLPPIVTPGQGSTLPDGSTDGDGSTVDEASHSLRGTLVGVPGVPRSPDGGLGLPTHGAPPRVAPRSREATLEMVPLERPRPVARFDTQPLTPPPTREDDGTEPVAAPIHLVMEAATSTRQTMKSPPVPLPVSAIPTAPIDLKDTAPHQAVPQASLDLAPPPKASASRHKAVTAPLTQQARAAKAASRGEDPQPDARVAKPLSPAEKVALERAQAARARSRQDATMQLPRVPAPKRRSSGLWLRGLAVLGAAIFGALMYFVVE